MHKGLTIFRRTASTAAALLALAAPSAVIADFDISDVPLFITDGATPRALLNISNDHQLYFEAYPDYADLDGDGKANDTYTHEFDYYGYFDSQLCYGYSGGVFEPVAESDADNYCSGDQWSGNFLNWISMARIDAVRKILYGGSRSTDESNRTVLERTYLPNDAHSWPRYYNKPDLPKLSPFALPEATSGFSNSSRNVDTSIKWFDDSGLSGGDVDTGDQLVLVSESSGARMVGVVTEIRDTDDLRVAVSRAEGSGAYDDWNIENRTRAGVTFCNTTVDDDGNYSQNVDDPPLIRAAAGDYRLWAANERWQCRWFEEKGRTGHSSMQIGGESFSNGNDAGITGIFSNSDNPRRDTYGLGENDYIARVQVCADGFVNSDDCKQYPDGNYKPVGLLQEFGDEDRLHFGMFTGSYERNKSGGVLRKNIGTITDEINTGTDGTFAAPPDDGSIIGSLDLLRIYGYNHDDGLYNDGDDCPFGITSFSEGDCSNWGNPQSEMLLESLRYLAGADSPDFGFSGDDKLDNLETASWADPYSEDNFCAPTNVINFNASVASYEEDDYDGLSDLPDAGSSVSDLTDVVGEGEGIHGEDWFVGEAGTNDNQLCTAKNVSSLGDVAGLCPEAPRLEGTYHMAGLSHYAWTNDLRPGLEDDQSVKTNAVSLAAAVPRIDIPRPGESTPAVTLLPACRNANGSNCALVDFRVVSQDTDAGTGSFFVQWEDSEQGGDYDMDLNGILSYQITDSEITVTTNGFAESSDQALGFGYVINGTNGDGFRVHSGSNGFSYADPFSAELGCTDCQVSDPPTSVTYSIGDSDADLLEPPQYYAAKWGGFNKDKDFPDDSSSWDPDGDGLPDNYYFSTNPAQLAEDLSEAFQEVAQTRGSSAAVATNSTRLDTGTLIYQARFDSEDWSGQLLALDVDTSDGSVDTGDPVWDAANLIPPEATRNIVTYDAVNETGIDFEWADLNTQQQDALDQDIENNDDGLGEERLEYLRGDQSDEAQNGGDFRDRSGPLGDIVNSDPFYVGTGNFGYSRLDAADGGFDVYRSFLEEKQDRTEVLYVGANDGMLHGFNAETGAEVMAYVPNDTFGGLSNLTSPDYEHRYYVDGSPRAGDAYLDGDWRTILAGGMGAGGRAIFALDVTEPDTFGSGDVLWEFTDPELGFTTSQPYVVRMNDDEWYVIFGNGYNSASEQARLFLVPLENPGNYVEINTEAGGSGFDSNGLGGITPVDIDGDRTTDYIYGGDAQGNMWKFDVSDGNTNQWDVAFSQGNTPEPLFTAEGPDGDPQPITAAPELGPHPDGGVMIYFGTGKFFEVGDNEPSSASQVQSFYALHEPDPSNGEQIDDRDTDLQEQTIIYEGSPDGVSDEFRVTSDEEVSDSQRGWFIDLKSPVNGAEGERVITRATLRNDRIIFVTNIPSQEICSFGGDSWIMEMDAVNGRRLENAVFDVNDDGSIDESDLIEGQGHSGGVKLDDLVTQPAILDTQGDTEFKYLSGSSGDIRKKEEASSAADLGRQSWRQLR
ncbi:pilus assembly protein [Halofilum ochraceum]|uniref:pilus assembly protein n=1 Tax=Halofilum ochraceum TaxID=1611323 RepID=UPI0008D962FD|nr:PilC/PilY family type IV pilus protein [Halofilum ochraceum]